MERLLGALPLGLGQQVREEVVLDLGRAHLLRVRARVRARVGVRTRIRVSVRFKVRVSSKRRSPC